MEKLLSNWKKKIRLPVGQYLPDIFMRICRFCDMRGMRLGLPLTFRGFAQVGGYLNLLCNITFGRGLSANFAKPLLGDVIYRNVKPIRLFSPISKMRIRVES